MDLTVEDVANALDACRPEVVERLPSLDGGQHARLVAGEVVRILSRDPDPDAPSSALGIAVFGTPLRAAWVAVQDPHAVVDPALTEFVIAQNGPDRALWYGHLDLPYPVRDRQWVVESTNTHGLASATGNRCWEHTWRLVPDGLGTAREFLATDTSERVTPAQLDEAIYTPVNHGSWLLVALPGERTLVAYQATSVIGGAIPDWLVLQLTMSRLESVLRSAESRAHDWALTHYRNGHAPIVGGDGTPVPLFP